MTRVLVLCYHALSPSWSAPLAITPERFERQVSSLLERGWSPVTFNDAVTRPAPWTVAITFDDAFASVMRYAAPVLRRLEAPATVFAPTDYVARQAPLSWPGLDRWQHTPDAPELTPMSWDDLRELAELGWEVGSHSRTHPLLTSLSDREVLDELGISREEAAEQLGRPITTLAYPYGAVDHRVAAIAQQVGYAGAAALSWPSTRVDRYRHPRVGVYQRDSWPRFRLKTGRWARSRVGARLLSRRLSHLQRA